MRMMGWVQVDYRRPPIQRMLLMANSEIAPGTQGSVIRDSDARDYGTVRILVANRQARGSGTLSAVYG